MEFLDCQEKVDVFLLGFGSVNQHVVKLMLQEHRRRPPLRIVGISDSSGGISVTKGVPLESVLLWKSEGNPLYGFHCESSEVEVVHHDSTLDMVHAKAKRGDILFDGTPVNLQTGGVGLECCRYALSCGIHVVLANKAPLVLAYRELVDIAMTEPKAQLEYSATVCGGLPVVNVGKRDLYCAQIDSVQGIFNSTSNYILSRLQDGVEPAAALQDAKDVGIAEADPSLDLEGYDTANKLIIICNTVLHMSASLSDMKVLKGMTGVTQQDVEAAALEGQVIRLVASATRTFTATPTYELTVQPECVPKASFLGSCVDTDMCIVFESDEFEIISMKTNEKGVFPTASAMLRDCYSIVAKSSN